MFKKNFYKPLLEKALVKVLTRALLLFLAFVLVLVILGTLGVDTSPLLAFGGLGIAAIGMASKHFISNCFGGLMFNLTRPFRVGDLIELPGKHLEGHVEEIGWLSTVIRDLEKQPIHLPNSLFSQEVLINQSRMSHRRFEEALSIPQEHAPKADRIVARIQEYFRTNRRFDPAQPMDVFISSFSMGRMVLSLRAYTVSAEYSAFIETKQKTLLEIYQIVKEEGADFSASFLEKLGHEIRHQTLVVKI